MLNEKTKWFLFCLRKEMTEEPFVKNKVKGNIYFIKY